MKTINKLFLIIATGLIILISILILKALSFSSKQIEYVEKIEESEIDEYKVSRHLSEALQFKTISFPDSSKIDGKEFLALHNYFEKIFTNLHTSLEKKVIGLYSLVYKWEGKDVDLKPMLLMAHIDVVPAPQDMETPWKHPPFSGTISEGYIWGRGTLDDKSSVLGILEAVEVLTAEGFQPERTIYLAFGHDEEVGGSNGAAKIANYFQSQKIEFEYILDEGGLVVDGMLPGLSAPTALIGIAEKGYLSIVLTAESPGGHSSAPPKHTAVGILSSAIHNLEKNPLPGELKGATEIMFEYIGPEMSFLPRVLFSNLWLTRDILEYQLSKSAFTNAMLRTTTAATMFEGSLAENVLPETAKATINFRIIPGDSITGIIEHVRNTLNDPLVKITPLSMGISGGIEASPISDVNSSNFTMLQYTIRQIFPHALAAPWLLIGSTDSKYFTKMCDNIYRFVPTQTTNEDMGGYHGSNERISIGSYIQTIRFYIQLIRNSSLSEKRYQ